MRRAITVYGRRFAALGSQHGIEREPVNGGISSGVRYHEYCEIIGKMSGSQTRPNSYQIQWFLCNPRCPQMYFIHEALEFDTISAEFGPEYFTKDFAILVIYYPRLRYPRLRAPYSCRPFPPTLTRRCPHATRPTSGGWLRPPPLHGAGAETGAVVTTDGIP